VGISHLLSNNEARFFYGTMDGNPTWGYVKQEAHLGQGLTSLRYDDSVLFSVATVMAGHGYE